MNCPDQSNPGRDDGERLTKYSPRAWRKFLDRCRPFRHWLLVPLLAVPLSSYAYAESASETAVKTAFLYNFFKFISWPIAVANQDTYSLCTTGNDKLGDSLAVLQHKSIGNKAMVIRRGVIGNDLKDCHLVFISASENATAIIQKLKGLPIVTVSDQTGFIDQGGTISFLQSDNRLNFEINLAAANKNGVHIGAQLLKLAKRVITEK